MPTLPDLSMIREERRFLLPDVAAVQQLLQQRGDFNGYRVRTLYVDTPEGTWSTDPSKPRTRLRIYDSTDTFLEVKLRVRGTRVYLKKRKKAPRVVPDGMVTLGISRYARLEWQQGDVRVTIDKGVATAGRTLQGYVVETKLPLGAPLPNWLKMLKPYEAPGFSKWRWVSG